MSSANEELVKRAFDACKRGDKDELRRVFDYDNSVQIQGAFCLADGYPAGKTDINYDPEDQGGGKVKTRVRWRPPDGKEYHATVVDTVSNGKITASTVEWTDYPYVGDTENEAPWYAQKYGWWGWPFGRGRR